MEATSMDPSTPENKVRMLVNRSFTLPPKFDTSAVTSPVPDIGSAEGVETLFVHPRTSIIKFSTARSASGTPARGLPWKSSTETTIAAGSLEIYRVPGSVSFLHSGTLLHAILPRSQCWCVDGVSKFAMRVLPETYYRIELPGETKEELDLVEGFKGVLAKVMHYERTACPFERNSGEVLPELEDIKNRRLKPEDNAKWLDRSRLRKTTPVEASPKQTSASPDRIKLRKRLDHTQEAIDKENVAISSASESSSTASRSVTAPSQLTIRPLDHSAKAPFETATIRAESKLKTFQAIPIDMPPSPPDSSAGIDSKEIDFEPIQTDLAEVLQSHTGMQDEEVVHVSNQGADASPVNEDEFEDSVLVHQHSAQDGDNGEMTEVLQQVATPIAIEELAAPQPLKRTISNPEDPFAAIQARILARRSIGGTTSFYPSTVRQSTSCSTSSVSSSASSRSSISQITQQRNLASALVRKACAVFIGPPAHLVALMLKIAARFANGTFGNMFFVESPSGSARHIPGSFEVHDDFTESSISDDEDDFGIPLHSPVRLVAAKNLRERKIKDGWDID